MGTVYTNQTLNIPELRREILSHLTSKSWGKKRKSLLACALACRNWRDDALDILWKSVGDIETIARAFGHIKRRDTSNPDDKMLVFEDTPNWERFHTMYSHRVRVLNINYTQKKHSCIVEALSDTQPSSVGRGFFPKLRGMRVDIEAESSPARAVEFFIQFMHQQVKSFRVDLDFNDPESPHILPIRILEAIRDHTPHLTSLRLDFVNTTIDQKLVEEIGTLCSRLADLKGLAIPHLASCDASLMVREIARSCTNLETLNIYAMRGFRPSTGIIPFSFLKKFSVPESAVGGVVSLLENHPMLKLRNLEVYADYLETPSATFAECQQLFRIIGSLTELEKLTFRPTVEQRLPFHIIRPLLQCSAIRSIDMKHINMSMIDDDLSFLGRCLPQLEDLRWCPLESAGLNQNHEELLLPTLQGIINLAEHAVNLRHLEIEIIPIYRTGSTELEVDTLSSFNCLEHLEFCFSCLDPSWSRAVSVILSHVLPFDCQFSWDNRSEYLDDGNDATHEANVRSDAAWQKVLDNLDFYWWTQSVFVTLPSQT
ncbi:hypothetical protein D9758_010526 [Tetrapyrgos nigripes]|uniref:F-box domain-containing protein n=1 Tax=Tetrapyrgos nigripes TaxID=182062 RepID=A0A8H5D169_9AGAR|nr:hypothetical protein D9758_010526 [Tetrapyrgos nigripes]